VPEKIEATALDQSFSRIPHHLPNLLPIIRAVAMNFAVFADRPLFERTVEATLNRIGEKFSTLRTTLITLKRKQLRREPRQRLTRRFMMVRAVN